ncbi:Na+/H+ antiporter NhaA [Malaciobacter mytili LMG 24559]|uniref:Na(+)/H(+) antiporter NhaA n=1 Tax=Malaciobacter mytili LMG 24559 TaxID=1032238 RepID=A0AAX2AJT4_9BACT|nr:Na+/H+ antiporter NhaA [Malaciobacter mytili]AXH15993.1 sodium:proton antiporter [Malaciobacter mytili LMG 24559]RXK15821.1 Na+/H+ antiporter NhaA [Malaciobacter mytili LMG 24559]
MKILVREYIKKESTAGIILIFVTIIALLFRNSFFSDFYDALLKTTIKFQFGEILLIEKPLILWINDGLMTVFFLLIGLEIKRELLAGHLSSVSKIALPAIAAVGGMIVPALIFIVFNYDNEFAMRGWAIPTATDIAFALGILSLLGKRIPVSLKIFLMALAIFDDLGAILIIAIFYTDDLSMLSFLAAFSCLVVLIIMNRLNIIRPTAYILVGIILWVSVLKSGVHATLAGIILAFTIPLSIKNDKNKAVSPLKNLEHNLHFWVAFTILPIFAFVNAGVNLKGLSFEQVFTPVSLGIILGLFLGKQLGVMLFVFLAVKLNLAALPRCSTWLQMYGVSVLTGIGFTMSLFIDSLAYQDSNIYAYTDKLAILIGSILSGVLGYFILKYAKSKKFCFI